MKGLFGQRHWQHRPLKDLNIALPIEYSGNAISPHGSSALRKWLVDRDASRYFCRRAGSAQMPQLHAGASRRQWLVRTRCHRFTPSSTKEQILQSHCEAWRFLMHAQRHLISILRPTSTPPGRFGVAVSRQSSAAFSDFCQSSSMSLSEPSCTRRQCS